MQHEIGLEQAAPLPFDRRSHLCHTPEKIHGDKLALADKLDHRTQYGTVAGEHLVDPALEETRRFADQLELAPAHTKKALKRRARPDGARLACIEIELCEALEIDRRMIMPAFIGVQLALIADNAKAVIIGRDDAAGEPRNDTRLELDARHGKIRRVRRIELDRRLVGHLA